MEALRRIKANQIEKRLLNARGEPNFNINFYVLNAKGEYAGVTMYNPGKLSFAVCDEKGPRLERMEPLLQGDAGITRTPNSQFPTPKGTRIGGWELEVGS